MGKATKKSKAMGSDNSESATARRAIAIHLLVLGVLVGAGLLGFRRLRQHVENDLAYPANIPEIVLKDRPIWMAESLAEQIASSIRPKTIVSAMDRSLLEKTAQTLQQNPWVRQVRQVRRLYGHSAGDLIEVDCEYRTPLALVATAKEYILVDGDGVRLPERFGLNPIPRIMFSADGRVNLRIVEGVVAPPPFKAGLKWSGEDLQAGLELVKFMYGRVEAEDIHRVNVANYGERQAKGNAEMVLITKYHTEIRWGKPLHRWRWEVSPTQKLERMANLWKQTGRVDGGLAWLDVRLDRTVKPDEEGLAQAGEGQ